MNPPDVIITEVGPRDGLQNEPLFVKTEDKIELINQLSLSGLQHIEVTSFVSHKSIPQLSDAGLVFESIKKKPGVQYTALIPNEQGLVKALHHDVTEIAVFIAVSESFNQRNIHCSIAEALNRIKIIINNAKLKNLRIRAYVSCALGCPYEGAIAPKMVLKVARDLIHLGVDALSFADTIGVGTPQQTKALIQILSNDLNPTEIAMHFHDTYGQAIANIYASLDAGVRRFDSSLAGLGGCPYAMGATGNVATEDVLYLMHGLGLTTGIDIYKIVAAGDWICQRMGRQNQSKVANALLATLRN